MIKNILITGTAGFIGYHLAKELIKDNNYNIISLDNINNYYDINLKLDRLRDLGINENIEYNKLLKSEKFNNFYFIKLNLEDKENIFNLFNEFKFKYVIHLAAQAGVRYSLKDPYSYLNSNIYGFLNILESIKINPVLHFIYASSSSVYGMNKKIPFSENDNVDHPVSLYAATKKSNELFAHTYSHLFGIPATGLRFFTVYGEWGRPDMAYFSFTEKIFKNQPIDVYNYGKMKRDFTYISDIVNSIIKIIEIPPEKKENNGFELRPSESFAPYRICNIGNNNPVDLELFINILEELIGKKAIINYKPMQPGDVFETYADIDTLSKITGIKPLIDIKTGLEKFVNWYKLYYKV